MMTFILTKEIAVLLAAFIGGMLSQSHRLFDLIFLYRGRRRRIRAYVFSDVKAMVQMTDALDLDEFLKSISQSEAAAPLIVDPTLPQDKSSEIMFENFDCFSEKEVTHLTAFYRHARASRAGLISLNQGNYPMETRHFITTSTIKNWHEARANAEETNAL